MDSRRASIMKRAYPWAIASTFVVVFFSLFALPASAEFHLFRIDQVYSNADGSVQYVVMRESTGSNFESFWMGNFLQTTAAAGMSQQFEFPSDLPSTNT